MNTSLPWIVWNVGGAPSTVQHVDYGTAKREASVAHIRKGGRGETAWIASLNKEPTP